MGQGWGTRNTGVTGRVADQEMCSARDAFGLGATACGAQEPAADQGGRGEEAGHRRWRARSCRRKRHVRLHLAGCCRRPKQGVILQGALGGPGAPGQSVASGPRRDARRPSQSRTPFARGDHCAARPREAVDAVSALHGRETADARCALR